MGEATLITRLTAEEFAALPGDGRRELLAGEVVEMAPASLRHGSVCLRIMSAVERWVTDHKLGLCASNDPGVVLSRGPDTVRAPDGLFYAGDRVAELPMEGFPDHLPDLVLEVVSTHDRRGDVLAKVGQWLDAGVQVVWVAWPQDARITVYGPGSEVTTLNRGDRLTCPALLPGFELLLDECFPA